MAYSEIRNTGSFSLELNSTSGSEIITLLDVATLTGLYSQLAIDNFLGFEFLLESLHLTVNIADENLGISPVPNVAPEDTQAERQQKLAEIQRDYPKMGLSFFKSVFPGAFKRQSMAVLQNPGYEWYLPLLIPFLTMSEVKLLGPKDKLGVQLVDLGDGILTADSSLLIEGSWRQVVTLTRKSSQQAIPTSFGYDVHPSSTPILAANPLRRLLWLSNPGTLRIWFSFSPTVPVNGTLYLEPNSSLSLETLELYIGEALYARTAAGTGRIVGLEGVLSE